MTAQPEGGAVARRDREDKLAGWLRARQDDLAMAAASHLRPATIIRVAQGALRRDDKLMAAALANPWSLLHCLLDAARLGHEAGTDQYWLVPFSSKDKNGTVTPEVTGIEGYKGIVERMYRAGGVSSVHVQVVRQLDAYRSMGDRMPPVHEYDDFADPADRGPLRGVYAYAIMTGGTCSQVIRMGRAEIERHKAMSRGSARPDSPWKLWEEAMWKKTPLRALEPYVPTSSEWLITRARAAAEAQAAPVTAPGWAPPVTPAPAPLQLIASPVTADQDTAGSQAITPADRGAPQDASPAETPAQGDRAPSSPRQGRRSQRSAGEAQPPMASAGQQARIKERFLNLGYADSADDEAAWLHRAARLAGCEGQLPGLEHLTADQAASVLRQLQGVTSLTGLDDLLGDGVKAQDAAGEARDG